MLYGVIFLIGLLFALSVYMVSLQAADAKQYHIWTMEKLEGAKYAEAVQDYCISHARQQGYDLKIEKETEDQREYQKVTLVYQMEVPFLGDQKTYHLTGYSQ